MTGYTGSLLAVKLAANAGVTLSWEAGYRAPALLVSFLIVPLLVYWLTRPEIKHTPDAPDLARARRWRNGQYDARRRWLMLATVGVLRNCCSFGGSLGVDARRRPLCRFSRFFITERRAHGKTLKRKALGYVDFGFAALLMMANRLKETRIHQLVLAAT